MKMLRLIAAPLCLASSLAVAQDALPPVPNPLTIISPSGIGALAPVPSTAVLNPLTLSSAAFGTGKFSQALSGGYAYTQPVISSLASIPFTVEAWVKTSATQTQVAVGQAQAFWLGTTSTGLATCHYGNDTALNSSINIADGNLHHLAVTATSTGGACYVDGVQTGTSSNAPSATYTNLFGVHAFGDGTIPFNGSVDEVAVWSGVKYTGNFTPPAVPYTTGAANSIGIWHLDGDGKGGLVDAFAVPLAACPTTAVGLRFYLAAGESITGTFAATVPTTIPATITIANTGQSLTNWDEKLSGQGFFLTGLSGSPKYRCY